MSEKTAPVTVTEPTFVESLVTAQTIEVKIRQIDPKSKGFLPLWHRIISVKRAMTDFQKAQPEDIDAAYSLLREFIIYPKTDAEKNALLDNITSEELMDLFNGIMGSPTVPPVKGGA